MIKHILTILVVITFTSCLLSENEEQKESNYQDNRSSSSVYYSSETVRPPVLDTVLFDCPKDSTYNTGSMYGESDIVTFVGTRTRTRECHTGGTMSQKCTGDIMHWRSYDIRETTCNYKIFSDNVLIDMIQISKTTTSECASIMEWVRFNSGDCENVVRSELCTDSDLLLDFWGRYSIMDLSCDEAYQISDYSFPAQSIDDL